jgi:hypothetical protein
VSFPIRDFKPCHARGRAAVRSRHAAGIQQKNASAAFVSWHVGVSVQKNINIARRLNGRNVLKTEFQFATNKIDDQWPFNIAVAIPTDGSHSRANRVDLIENGFHANISQMPDFIRPFGDFDHISRQTIVRVRKNKNAQGIFQFFLFSHWKQTEAQKSSGTVVIP